MEVPAELSADPLLARGVEGQPTIRRILEAAGLLDREHVIDYGGGTGTWVWSLPGATVYDPSESDLAQGRAMAESNVLPVTFTSDRESIEPGDGMISVAVQQYLSDAEIHDFFAFAASRLRPGGRLLATLAHPLMVLEWVVRGERLKQDGWLGQAAWMRQALMGALLGIGHGPRKLYCHRTGSFVRAAREHGFRHETTLPHTLDAEYRRMIGARNRGIFYRWLVFERAADQAQPAPRI